MSSNNCLRRALRRLDLAVSRSFSGSAILGVIVYMDGAFLFLMIVVFSIVLKGALTITENTLTYAIILYIIIFVYAQVSHIHCVYLLWKGWKMQSQSSLKRYMKVVIPYFILYVGSGVYLRHFEFRDPAESIRSRIAHIFSVLIICVIICYKIHLVYRCIRMLDAPWLTRFKEDFQNNYSTFLGNDCDRTSKIEVEIPDGVGNDVSTILDIQEFLISPLKVEFGYDEVLGEGQFGIVCKGRLLQKGVSTSAEVLSVALKQVKNPEESFESFLQEIKIMIRVGYHQNIVKFYGLTSNGLVNNHLAIITQFCDGGCLDLFLKKKRHTFVNLLGDDYVCLDEDRRIYTNLDNHGTPTTKDLMRIAAEIAEGMEHFMSKKVLHGDLAARNVLLDGPTFTVKLTDFGMSRRLYNYELYCKGDINQESLVPWRWMAPEALMDLKFSEKSDVWSYGIVLWEIFTLGEFPFKDLNWSQEVLKELVQGLRLEKPRYSTLDIWNLMNTCWAKDPRARITFSQIRQWWNESNLKI